MRVCMLLMASSSYTARKDRSLSMLNTASYHVLFCIISFSTLFPPLFAQHVIILGHLGPLLTISPFPTKLSPLSAALAVPGRASFTNASS